jgi:hypothetical protein
MTDLREKLAKDIYDQACSMNGDDKIEWCEQSFAMRQDFLGQADAALAAFEEFLRNRYPDCDCRTTGHCDCRPNCEDLAQLADELAAMRKAEGK